MITVKLSDNTIPHDISMKLGSAKVLLKPASKGRGVIAGGAVRAVVDLAGIRDIVSKSLGTSNKLNVARVTIEALKALKAPRIKEIKDAQEVKVVAKENVKEVK